MKEIQNKPKKRTLSEISGFMPLNDNSYYLNSAFVKTLDQIVTKNGDYMLIYFSMTGELQFESVKFLSANISPNEDIAIKLLHNRDSTTQIIDLAMNSWPSIYVLVDIHSFAMEMNSRFTDHGNRIPNKNNRVLWSDVVQLVKEETKKWLEESVFLDFDF